MTPLRSLRSVRLLPLVIPLLVLGACSDGDDDAGDTTTTSASATTAATEEALVADLDRICGESNAAMGEIFGPLAELEAQGPVPDQVVQETYGKFLAELQSQQTELESLTPPAELSDDWEQLVAAHDAAVTTVEVQGPAFFEQDTPDPFAEVEAMAVELGATGCATE
jgi:hypothetical protein